MSDVSELTELEGELRSLRWALVEAQGARAVEIAACHPIHRAAAVNLVHYVELRSHDVRPLQGRLARLGLSSLGRAESHVLATIDSVLTVLTSLARGVPADLSGTMPDPEQPDGLEANADRLLGPRRADRSTRIMVTLPTEAAIDPGLCLDLVSSGMDVARINCAHDDARTWSLMAHHVRAPEQARPCIVAMDLAGPKLRTGPLAPGPRVVRLSPTRDALGRVLAPALAWLSTEPGSCPTDVGRAITDVPVDDRGWVSRRRRGDRVHLSDSRGARRRWTVVDEGDAGCLVSSDETTYVATGLKLTCRHGDADDAVGVADLPPVERSHRVRLGDRVILTRSLEPATPRPGSTRHVIGCTLPEAFVFVRPHEHVWLDDGKIGGIVERVTDDEIEMAVTDVRPGGAKLKGGKGINLPDTDLALEALTAKDLEDLEAVARHADVVDLSFVRRPSDVARLQSELERLGASHVGIVLKIENAAAFACLPELLLTAMRSENVGVMIARGDLAVEVGFERMAEVQEEIMWVCEAAGVPVIWATEVLDTMARTGRPSRSEVTDAAMAERAECVMLNKGPYIAQTIATLDSILNRMQHHQDKKQSLLRRLRAWDHTDPS